MWDQLPVGLLAQLVERCTDIAKVVGYNSLAKLIFFLIYLFNRNSHIWFLYIKCKNKKDVNKPVKSWIVTMTYE